MPKKSPTAQSHGASARKEWSAEVLRAVVVTMTANVEGEVALTFTVAGTEQLAPVGAPVQLSVAVPLNPVPPIASE